MTHRSRGPGSRPRPGGPRDRRPSGGPPHEHSARKRGPRGSAGPPPAYEAETLFGLEPFAEDELRRRLGQSVRLLGRPAPGRVAMAYVGADAPLDALRSVVAIHRVETFAVPRPKALLGHEHLTRLAALLQGVMARQPRGAFETFRVSAAGADSPVFQRLKAEIARATGLTLHEEEAQLQIAVRPAPGGKGWQVLVRRTPRPLSARAWRVCNMPGALDATIAHVMVTLARPRAEERFLNLACGSGTLLVERLAEGPARAVLGIDIDPRALDCARDNLQVAGRLADAHLVRAGAGRAPLGAGQFDTVVADLPWALLVGTRRENEALYPALLAEAARVAAPGATLVLITASHRVFEEALARGGGRWVPEATYPLRVPWERGYLEPRIHVLRRAED